MEGHKFLTLTLEDEWSALADLASQTQIPLYEPNSRMVWLYRLSAQEKNRREGKKLSPSWSGTRFLKSSTP